MCFRALREPVRVIPLLLAILLLGPACYAGTVSLSSTGTLGTPEDVYEQVFTLSAAANLEIQTWSFGGGTNAAGAAIPAGGFDPLVALFSGPVESASIYLVAGNPAADADTFATYTGNCPPAGTVAIGTGAGSVVCGDDALTVTGVPAGTYTLLLSDANYIPYAVNPGPPDSSLLSDGFADLTAGVFQTCNTTSDGTTTCITPTSDYAVDIVDLTGADLGTGTGSGTGSGAVPEPAVGALTLIGLAALRMFRRRILDLNGGKKCSF
jgi:hypothetical protein